MLKPTLSSEFHQTSSIRSVYTLLPVARFRMARLNLKIALILNISKLRNDGHGNRQIGHQKK